MSKPKPTTSRFLFRTLWKDLIVLITILLESVKVNTVYVIQKQQNPKIIS